MLSEQALIRKQIGRTIASPGADSIAPSPLSPLTWYVVNVSY